MYIKIRENENVNTVRMKEISITLYKISYFLVPAIKCLFGFQKSDVYAIKDQE